MIAAVANIMYVIKFCSSGKQSSVNMHRDDLKKIVSNKLSSHESLTHLTQIFKKMVGGCELFATRFPETCIHI